MNPKYWNEFRLIDGESKVTRSKNKEATFYILRAENNNDEILKTDLDKKTLLSVLSNLTNNNVCELKEKRQNVNYVKDIKYIDSKGTINNRYYYACYFQSNCEIPSVSIRYVPTAYVIVYDDKADEENIIEMIKTIKEWTFRLD